MALRQSEGRLRRFVADASHELRTPVAAVSAYAELFERGAESRPQDLARVMSGIRGETARMGHLVEDLLLLARLDESRPFERSPVDLVAVATEAVEAARAVGPEWQFDVDATGPVVRLRGLQPAPAGVRQPAVERPGPHAARYDRDHRYRPGRRRGALPGHR